MIKQQIKFKNSCFEMYVDSIINIEPEIKVKLTEKTGDIEFRLVEGSDEFIQLESLMLFMSKKIDTLAQIQVRKKLEKESKNII